MDFNAKIYVAGHRGLAGSALVRALRAKGFDRLLLRSHAELNLEDWPATESFFRDERPEIVFLAAAKVGGILANNSRPAEFLMRNLQIEQNVCRAAHQVGVSRLVFLGSSCIYPRDCPQPIKEEYLLSGPLESTNRPYALAKIVGVEMCWDYNRQYGTQWLAAMPTNLYGPGDNYDLEGSHVLPALIRKIHVAKSANSAEVVLWGSGRPRREFLHADDLARALVFLTSLDAQSYGKLVDPAQCPIINIGTGSDITILELAEKIALVAGYQGRFVLDASKPDGTPQKLLDVTKLRALGWREQMSLDQGLFETYSDFCSRPELV